MKGDKIMETKEMKAEISKKFSKSAWILLACWVAIFTVFTTLCFVYGKVFQNGPAYSFKYYDIYTWLGIEYGRETLQLNSHSVVVGDGIKYDGGMLFLVIFLNIFIFAIVPLIYLLINRRKRKLTELTANEKEIVGSYTAFIPISKLALKMPIDTVDNITVVNSKFYWFTGKMIRIGSTSSVIKIPYVINADEVVAFISEAIEKAKNNKRVQPEEKPEPQRRDAADNLKKIADLRDAGIITEEEFEQKKKELLGKM